MLEHAPQWATEYGWIALPIALIALAALATGKPARRPRKGGDGLAVHVGSSDSGRGPREDAGDTADGGGDGGGGD